MHYRQGAYFVSNFRAQPLIQTIQPEAHFSISCIFAFLYLGVPLPESRTTLSAIPVIPSITRSALSRHTSPYTGVAVFFS
jgi:hypothetical protein